MKNDLAHFSLEFQEKVKKFRRWQDAQLSILGRKMVFECLKNTYNVCVRDEDMNYEKYQKPYFEKTKVKFNISHSGNIVVCAFSDEAEVGIDIELIQTIEVNDFKSQMTNKEWSNVMLSSNQEEAFFEYWTQKEAVIKAHGKGLSIPLKTFEVNENRTTIDGNLFWLNEIKINKSYKCFVAFDKEINTYTLNHFT